MAVIRKVDVPCDINFFHQSINKTEDWNCHIFLLFIFNAFGKNCKNTSLT
jgi:hypothetical protein